jgi:hemolysin activation/secretion protein
VQASVFYDLGGVSVNKTVFDAGTANSRRLAGAGVGVQAQMKGVQFKTALAWRTSGGAPVSVPAANAKSPIWWLQAALAF